MNKFSRYLRSLLILMGLLLSGEGFALTNLRVAVFNIKEFNTEIISATDDQGRGNDSQVLAAAEIIQQVRPDVLLICEIDYDYGSQELGLAENARRFQRNYLSHGKNPIDYPHVFVAPNNTGILSGADLNNDGIIATMADEGTPIYANDCFGWGVYRGQYSMVIYSKYPLDEENARTFQKFLWKDLPGNHLPRDYYPPKAIEVLRLSSKSHWDVPVKVGGQTIHLLACHPTPQGFDGPEDRNGRRNFDELLFWKYYIDNNPALVDDKGQAGGLSGEKSFVLFGDLNATPTDGSRYDNMLAIETVLKHPRVQESGHLAVSEGVLQGRKPGPPTYPERHTIGHRDTARLDYVLPSTDLKMTGGGMFWPDPAKDLHGALLAHHASDHRMIWVDFELEP